MNNISDMSFLLAVIFSSLGIFGSFVAEFFSCKEYIKNTLNSEKLDNLSKEKRLNAYLLNAFIRWSIAIIFFVLLIFLIRYRVESDLLYAFLLIALAISFQALVIYIHSRLKKII